MGSSKGVNNSASRQSNAKYMVQIQKDQNEMIEINEMEGSEMTMNSPAKTNNMLPMRSDRRSSAAHPLNINLGSDTRFSNLGKNLLSGDRAGTTERRQLEKEKEATAVTAFERRKQSADACASEFRSKIKQARPRVDCWNNTNRSASRGENTPGRQELNFRQSALPQPQVLSQSMGGRRNRGEGTIE